MKITVRSSQAVKPAAYVGRTGQETWDATVAPLSVFDLVNFDDFISGIHLFHPPAPTTEELVAGLARALADYREWAGRLGVDPTTGRRAILLTDAGARFVEAMADVTLDSVMPLQPSPEVLRLHPGGGGGDVAEELLLVQVTRFACGSLAVGHTMHHAVGDGLAMAQFVVAWGQATRGVAVDPVPVHDRVSFFVPRDPPRVAFEHRGAEFKSTPPSDDKDACRNDVGGEAKVVTHVVRFTREFVSELKAQASSEGMPVPVPFSTTQCVVAHLWRCITKARRLDGGEATRLHVAVNGRARMRRPPVPAGYTGNVVLWAHASTTARELLAGPLQRTAELIRREVGRIDDAYFRSFIDFASSGDVEKERLVTAADTEETTLSPNVAVYCLQRVPFYDLDFGGGQQFLFMPSYQPVEGVVYILPASHAHQSDGSVEAHVSLFSHAMDTFKDCCYSIRPEVLH
jgi:hypothetical protein